MKHVGVRTRRDTSRRRLFVIVTAVVSIVAGLWLFRRRKSQQELDIDYRQFGRDESDMAENWEAPAHPVAESPDTSEAATAVFLSTADLATDFGDGTLRG
jgi:hypothetical protein